MLNKHQFSAKIYGKVSEWEENEIDFPFRLLKIILFGFWALLLYFVSLHLKMIRD